MPSFMGWHLSYSFSRTVNTEPCPFDGKHGGFAVCCFRITGTPSGDRVGLSLSSWLSLENVVKEFCDFLTWVVVQPLSSSTWVRGSDIALITTRVVTWYKLCPTPNSRTSANTLHQIHYRPPQLPKFAGPPFIPKQNLNIPTALFFAKYRQILPLTLKLCHTVG